MKLFFLFLSTIFVGSLYGQNPEPKVIPAVQNWQGGEGKFGFSEKTNLTFLETEKELKMALEIFSEDLLSEFKIKNKILNKPKQKGEIFFNLKEKSLPDEGYIIDIQKDKIEVSAKTYTGVFWATRTLLQLIKQDKNLPVGKITDFPAFPNRGFMLDAGRKYFSIKFLQDYIKLLSYYKINEFQVHLNDNGFKYYFDNDWNKTYEAFRLESSTFPGLTAKDGHYTKQEFTELQKMGMRYGVNVIPEIDVPAHSLSFVKYKPEIGSDKYGRDHLDLYKPETYEFVDALYKEYISGENPTFIGPDVHIGTDEYDKKESEKYREFTDRYLKYIQKLGKRVRMWDGLRWLKGTTPVTAENVIVNAWSHDWSDPFESSKAGYKIINTCDSYLYIVPSAGYYRDFLDEKWLYNDWSVEKINHNQTMKEGDPALLGAMFAVWNDHCGNGISHQDVHYRVLPAVKVLSHKMWNRKNKVSFEEFKQFADNLAEAPRVNYLGNFGKKTGKIVSYALKNKKEKDLSGNGFDELERKNIKIDKKQNALIFSENSLFTTPLQDIGYDYSVSFDLNLSSQTKDRAVIFSSENSKVFVKKYDNHYKIGFSRDGYTYEFNTQIPVNEWVNVKIEGTYNTTSLFLNKQEEKLSAITQEFKREDGKVAKMYYQQTLVFPLKYIGDKQNSFAGMLKNFEVYKK